MGELITAVPRQAAHVVTWLRAELGPALRGAYLIGSAASHELRPDSDVDVLVVLSRSLNEVERRSLLAMLLRESSWPAIPDAAIGGLRRPLEVTVLVAPGASADAPRGNDFQFGEWLRDEYERGHVPLPRRDPDTVLLLETAHTASITLFGATLASLLARPQRDAVCAAMDVVLPSLVADLSGDERNVILTLARMVVTARSGGVVSKDSAAEAVRGFVSRPTRAVLDRARDGYLSVRPDDWTDEGETRAAVDELIALFAAAR